MVLRCANKMASLTHCLGPTNYRASQRPGNEELVSNQSVNIDPCLPRLAEPLAITPDAVIQHLRVSEESGLVRTEKTGRVPTRRIESAGLRVAERCIADRRSIWERGLDRFGEIC
jgi:hypothetical protein